MLKWIKHCNQMYFFLLNAPLHYVFCLDLNMYDRKVISKPIAIFCIDVWYQIVQFVSTASNFPHIMIRHVMIRNNIYFKKNGLRLMLLIIFHLNCISFYFISFIFYISFMKSKSRGSNPLNRVLCKRLLQWILYNLWFPAVSVNPKSVILDIMHEQVNHKPVKNPK